MNVRHQPNHTHSNRPAHAAWERRRRAAWYDYLRTTQSAERDGYTHAEANAWEVLQRRLRRNDELLAETARHG